MTHWNPSYKADEATRGVCGTPGPISMHVKMSVNCPACLLIAMEMRKTFPIPPSIA